MYDLKSVRHRACCSWIDSPRITFSYRIKLIKCSTKNCRYPMPHPTHPTHLHQSMYKLLKNKQKKPSLPSHGLRDTMFITDTQVHCCTMKNKCRCWIKYVYQLNLIKEKQQVTISHGKLIHAKVHSSLVSSSGIDNGCIHWMLQTYIYCTTS